MVRFALGRRISVCCTRELMCALPLRLWVWMPIAVHRIGRTGRRGKTGVATTFINKNCSEQILLDLKHLLIEAKQRLPPVLAALEEYEDNVLLGDDNDKGCSFCGGLGHRIAQCPKLEAQRAKEASVMRDRNQGTRGGGEM